MSPITADSEYQYNPNCYFNSSEQVSFSLDCERHSSSSNVHPSKESTNVSLGESPERYILCPQEPINLLLEDVEDSMILCSPREKH